MFVGSICRVICRANTEISIYFARALTYLGSHFDSYSDHGRRSGKETHHKSGDPVD